MANEATQVNDLIFSAEMDEPPWIGLARQPGYERAIDPACAFSRGGPANSNGHAAESMSSSIPATMHRTNSHIRPRRPWTIHRLLFQVQLEPWYYDPQMVADSKIVPLQLAHSGYYREHATDG